LATTWERECIDLAELARLRRVEKLTVEEIAERVGRSSSGVKKAAAQSPIGHKCLRRAGAHFNLSRSMRKFKSKREFCFASTSDARK
jgi:hypothetical protein